MGFFEAAIVIYIRLLFYPDGFTFPLVIVTGTPAIVEILREAASILMLVAFSFSVFKKTRFRIAAFLITFALWDIFYYIFLKIFLDWPATLMDWDILYLIPLPWVSPVIAPVLISFVMLAYGLYLTTNRLVKFTKIYSFLLGTGIILILISFMEQYQIVLAGQDLQPFSWWIYIPGFVLGIVGLGLSVRK